MSSPALYASTCNPFWSGVPRDVGHNGNGGALNLKRTYIPGVTLLGVGYISIERFLSGPRQRCSATLALSPPYPLVLRVGP